MRMSSGLWLDIRIAFPSSYRAGSLLNQANVVTTKKVPLKTVLFAVSRWRESNPSHQLGKLEFYR